MFEGFPEEALDFYDGLLADNTKAYWSDHRALYESAVRGPFLALLARLEPEFGPAKLFRPYRDVRFSKDKTPYKTHAGAVVADASAEGGLYVQLSAEGLYVAGGYWRTQTDQARRLRAAAAADRSGAALVSLLADLGGWDVGGDRLKRLPAPWDAEHPRAPLLTLKTLVAGRTWEPAEWLHTPEVAADRVATSWRALAPLGAWLAEHVGPSERPARTR